MRSAVRMRNLWLLFLVGLVATGLTEKVPTTSLDDLYLEGRTSGDFPVDDEDGDDGGSGSGSGDDNWMVQAEKFIRMTDFFRTTQSSDVDGPAQQQTTFSPAVPSATAAPSQRSTTVKDLKSPDTVTDGASEAEEGANVEPTADWFTQEPTRPSQTSSAAPRRADEVDEVENNSLDEGTVAPTTEAEEVLPTGVLENEIVPRDGRGWIHDADRATGKEVTSENMWERKEVLAAVIACGVVGFLCAVLLLTLLAYRLKKKDEGSYDLGDTKLTNTQYQKAPTKEFYA